MITMNELPPKLTSSTEASEDEGPQKEPQQEAPTKQSVKLYKQVLDSIEEMAVHLKPLLENGSDEDSSSNSCEDCATGSEETSINIANEDNGIKNSTSTTSPSNGVSADSNGNIKNASTSKTVVPDSLDSKKVGNPTVNKKSTKTNSANVANHKNSESQHRCVLSRPMQRKLFSLLQCQLLEEEGQARSARIARSLGERVVMELLVLQQYPHQLSSNLWAAVRTRGCQFLGPAMQEEVLKLILLALEDGSPLSRKVLVLFVVQKLEVRYSQASKTAIGHVVQLLYRASCFKVQKRDGESSLMQLKEEFRQYEALRREHDSQIVQIALEAGLRISPEQWSSLLYGDVAHKPHMQSIIDKHQSPQSFSQNIAELMGILEKNPDGANLLSLRPHLEFLSNIDPSPDSPALSWENLGVVMRSVSKIISAFVDYLSHNGGDHVVGEMGGAQDSSLNQNTRYKTSMCRDYSSRGTCPRGPTCTFAHTQEEMEKYRLRSRKNGIRGRLPTQEKTTSSLTQSESNQLRQVQLMSKLKDELSAQTNGRTALSGVKELEEATQRLALSVNNSPSVMTMLPGNPNFPSNVKFNPADIENRPRVSGVPPATRLTFSRPALDGAEPSNPSAINQQASLHPNNPYARPFYPSSTVPLAPPPPTHFQGGGPLVPGSYSAHPPDAGGPVLQGPPPPLSSAVNQHSYIPGSDLRLPNPSGDYSSPHTENDTQVMMEQFLQQQQQQQQQQCMPVMPYAVQQQANGSTSLKDLCQRKQDIIQHLRDDPTFLGWQDPSFYQADSRHAGFHGLDTVLNLNKQTRAPMPKPVSDMFVATRSTQSLDKLAYEDLTPALRQYLTTVSRDNADYNLARLHQLGLEHSSQPIRARTSCANQVWTTSSSDWPGVSGNAPNYNSCNPTTAGEGRHHSTQPSRTVSAVTTDMNTTFRSFSSSASNYQQGHQMTVYNSLSSSSSSSSSQPPINSCAGDSEFSHFPADDEDEDFIPFEQTKVSKFGPISRLNKARLDCAAPVQATADLTRPTFRTAEPTYSTYSSYSSESGGAYQSTFVTSSGHRKPVERLVSEPAVKPTPLENRSIWEQSPQPSYHNIAQLMAGAAGAVSNNEKLAYQLQAVELEISLKTGRKPEPVSKMIQAAVGPSPDLESKGMMGTGHVTSCLRNMELGTDVKAHERFDDWNGVFK